MKAIITGGAGFIGSAVCRHAVLELGWQVLNLDALTYAANLSSLASIEAHPNYQFIKADVCDRTALDAIFADFQPDCMLHLAAESHVDRSITGSAAFINTNIVGTYTVLEAVRAYHTSCPNFRLLHVSTDEVYGSLGDEGLFTETTPYSPRSPYSASKAASDHLVMAWHETYELNALISNCSNNYGPYHLPEKLIPLMILNALEGKPLPVYGDGSNVRDWLFVDDHARALTTIVQHGRVGETYNVGGRNERTNLQVVETICDLVDALALALPNGQPRRSLIAYVADRPGHDKRYAIDATKLEQELGWRAQENFDTGLRKTVAWFLEHQEWWQPLRWLAAQRQGLLK